MRVLIATFVLAGIMSPATSPAWAEFNGKPCQCRFDGGKVDEGTVMCITTPQGSQLMMCDTVLNNSAWKKLQDGCEISMHRQLKMSPKFLADYKF